MLLSGEKSFETSINSEIILLAWKMSWRNRSTPCQVSLKIGLSIVAQKFSRISRIRSSRTRIPATAFPYPEAPLPTPRNNPNNTPESWIPTSGSLPETEKSPECVRFSEPKKPPCSGYGRFYYSYPVLPKRTAWLILTVHFQGYNLCVRCTQFSQNSRMENSSSIDCTVVFTVNRRVRIVGLQVRNPKCLIDFINPQEIQNSYVEEHFQPLDSNLASLRLIPRTSHRGAYCSLRVIHKVRHAFRGGGARWYAAGTRKGGGPGLPWRTIFLCLINAFSLFMWFDNVIWFTYKFVILNQKI